MSTQELAIYTAILMTIDVCSRQSLCGIIIIISHALVLFQCCRGPESFVDVLRLHRVFNSEVPRLSFPWILRYYDEKLFM